MSKVAVVTESHQGLGFAVVQALCKALGPDASVYLTARDRNVADLALLQLRKEHLSPQLHLLDLTKDESVAALAETIRSRHGGVDIVVSSTSTKTSRERPPAEQVAFLVDRNNHGTLRLMRQLGPLLRENARFIVAANSFCKLQDLSPALRGQFDVATRSLEDIQHVMDDYAGLVKAGQAEAKGWPRAINVASKVAQVASAKIMARITPDAPRRGILINAACATLVDATRAAFDDMVPAQSPSELAGDIVWLATLPAWTSQPHGELLRHRDVVQWV